MERVNLALIGCGYWGKNYLSTISNNLDINLKYVVDLEKLSIPLPYKTKYSSDINEVLNDNTINGIIVSTPSDSHYKIASKILESKKHVLVEKPLTTNSAEAEKLCHRAVDLSLVLMVGHIFKYNNAVINLKERIDRGEIGDLKYIESRRVGLGPVRQDVSVLWDLATHDIYISNFLVGNMPKSVNCTGISHNGKINDIVSLNMKYPKDIFSSIYVNWEHPIKEREIVVGGSEGAILFNDINMSEKLKIYERGINYQPSSGNFGEFQSSIRDGNIFIPKIKHNQPLDSEVRHFVDCIKGKSKVFTSGFEGLETVKVLEASEESINKHGLEVKL